MQDDDQTPKGPFTGRFRLNRARNRMEVYSPDVAAYIGMKKNNYIASSKRLRQYKPAADLLYCDADASVRYADDYREQNQLWITMKMIQYQIKVLPEKYRPALRAIARAFPAARDTIIGARNTTERVDEVPQPEPDAPAAEMPAPEAVMVPVTINGERRYRDTDLAQALGLEHAHLQYLIVLHLTHLQTMGMVVTRMTPTADCFVPLYFLNEKHVGYLQDTVSAIGTDFMPKEPEPEVTQPEEKAEPKASASNALDQEQAPELPHETPHAKPQPDEPQMADIPQELQEFRDIHEICTATDGTIGGKPALVVDAAALHRGLGVTMEHSKWLKRRITEGAEFASGIDYEEFSPKMAETGRPAIRLRITLDCAKRVAMAEKTPMAYRVRLYYMALENLVIKKVETDQANPSDNTATIFDRMATLMDRMMDRMDQSNKNMLEVIKGTFLTERNQDQNRNTTFVAEGWETGTESITDFCSHFSGLTAQKMHQDLHTEGRIVQTVEKMWKITPDAEEEKPQLVINRTSLRIAGKNNTANIQRTIALTKEGIHHYSMKYRGIKGDLI